MGKRFLLLLPIALFPLFLVGLVIAQEIGLNIAPILITNTSGSIQSRVQLPFPLSSQTLIDGDWMDADALFTDMVEPYMPATGQVRILACFDDVAADETTACNNSTTGDMTLPTAVNEIYEFAFDNQAKHLWANVGTAAVADWTVEWQYYNGISYVALSNVGDGTNEFVIAGLNRVSWDFPAAGAWPESTLHSVTGYWVRAEVTAVTTVTTPPLGTQAFYETGRWWTFAEIMAISEQRRFNLNLDTTIPRTFHHYYPHDDGISVTDEAGMELGTDDWAIEIKGYIDATAPASGAAKKIAFKDGSFEVEVVGEVVIQVQITE